MPLDQRNQQRHHQRPGLQGLVLTRGQSTARPARRWRSGLRRDTRQARTSGSSRNFSFGYFYFLSLKFFKNSFFSLAPFTQTRCQCDAGNKLHAFKSQSLPPHSSRPLPPSPASGNHSSTRVCSCLFGIFTYMKSYNTWPLSLLLAFVHTGLCGCLLSFLLGVYWGVNSWVIHAVCFRSRLQGLDMWRSPGSPLLIYYNTDQVWLPPLGRTHLSGFKCGQPLSFIFFEKLKVD